MQKFTISDHERETFLGQSSPVNAAKQEKVKLKRPFMHLKDCINPRLIIHSDRRIKQKGMISALFIDDFSLRFQICMKKSNAKGIKFARKLYLGFSSYKSMIHDKILSSFRRIKYNRTISITGTDHTHLFN